MRSEMEKDILKILVTEEDLQRRVAELGAELYEKFEGKNPLFLGVLNGSFMFMSDLMKKVDFNCELSFVKLASYAGTSTTGKVQELIGLKNNIEGRHVIVVEDIVDTGESIEHLMRSLSGHNPASVEVATLFFKPNSYSKQIAIKYKALEIGNEFIVGYGLDYDQLGRNLKDVFVVVNE